MNNNKTTDTLPKGWIWTTIPELFVIIGGGTPAKNNISFWNGDINWASVKDIKSKYLTETIDKISIEGLEYSNTNIANKGDLILVTRMSPGQVVIVKRQTAVNQDLKILKIFGSMPNEFVYYLICSYKNKFIELSSGTTVKGLKINDLKLIQLPLPPLEEQHRIVSRIEELFSELDHAEVGLKKAQKQLKVYRQALLKSAFEGKLTRKWRKENLEFDSYTQLSQIKKERKTSVKDIGIKESSDFSFNRSDLISSWAIATLDNLIGINARIGWRGLTKDEYTSEGPLFLSVHSLNYGKTVVFNEANHITIARYEESPEIRLQIDDILLCKDGAGIGKTGIIKHLPGKSTVNSSLLVIRPMEAFIPDFLYYLFIGPSMQKIVSEKISGSAIPHLFQKDIKRFRLHVPPKEEQIQIVQELESRFTLINELELSIELGLRKVQIFRQIILKKAFEGKLEPQFSQGEPANELLKRIQLEKEIYLIEKKVTESQKPKKIKLMETEKSILVILQESQEPILAKDLWLQSKHKDNIEDFYSELKEIYNQIKEVKKQTESFISLKI